MIGRLGKLSLFIVFCLLITITLLTPTAPANAEVIGEDQKPLNIDLDGGALVRLSRQAAAVFVSNPAIADVQIKTPTLVYVFGKAAGETSLFAVDENENILVNRKVVVNYNLSRLKESIRTMLPASSINVTSMDGGVVLGGQVNSASEAENIRMLVSKFVGSDDAIVNNLQVVGANQVNLRVRVAEVSRDLLKNIGFNWDAILNPGSSFLFGLATGRAPLAGVNTFSNRFVDPSSFKTFRSVYGSYNGTDFDVNGVIDLLESEGMISVLAEPNLTALSGETANFLAGGEFPVPVAQSDDQLTIEFKTYGVGLAFTPTIVGENRISMRIRPEVSQLSNQGAVTLNNIIIPALTTRRAETTVELGSGQSFAIAGLIQQSGRQDIDKFPGLGDLPILGALFRSDRFNRRETELVIIVTPYLVKPSSVKLAAPTDGFTLPTDSDRILGGYSYHPSNKAVTSAPAPSAGFIME